MLLLGEWLVRRLPALQRFNILAVVQRHGPARKAFLIVPPTGAMLVDITNAFSITALLNMLK